MQHLAAFILMLIRLLLGAILLLSVALICANAFGRYVLHAPIIWAEEVLSYALVWMVYLGAVQVTNDQGHLRMDLVVQGLPPGWRRVARLIGDLVFLAVGALIIYQANDSIRQFTHHSQITELPMDVLHAVIPASFVLMVVLVVMQGIAALREADDAPSRTVQ